MPIYDYIITGGAGFIGSNLAELLSRDGKSSVLIIDNFYYNSREPQFKNVGYFLNRKNVHFLFSDYRYFWNDSEDDKISAKKAIYHLAANTNTTNLDIEEQINNNCDIDFLNWAREQKVPFIFASSASLYGDGKEFNEDSPLNPLNPYAFSKLLLEKEVNNANFNQSIGFRFFNVFGKNEASKGSSASMVYQIVQAGKENRTIELFKDGNQSRDFVPVEFVCYVLALAAESNCRGIYNLGTGTATSFNSIVEYAGYHLKKKMNVRYIENRIAKAFQNFTQANINKLIRDFDIKYSQVPYTSTEIELCVRKMCT